MASNVKSASVRKPESQFETEKTTQFPLGRRNFIFMAAAGIMIVIGFLLMLGGGSTTEEFNPDIFSTRRIVVGPTIAFLGFVAMAAAIMIRPSSDDKPEA